MKIHFNGFVNSFLAITVLLLSTIACGFSTGYRNTPEGVTRKLFDSLQENDVNKYLDSITPVDRQQPGYFFYRQLIQGIFAGFGLGQMEASKLKISFNNMKYEEVSNDGRIAQVQVTGKLRDLNLGLEQDFSTPVTVVKIDKTWLVSLTGKTEIEILATSSPTEIPAEQKFAEPPSTPEQIVASEWLDTVSRYRNARFETLNNDGTFATVKITFDNFDKKYQTWIEVYVTIDLRYIGGKWNVDTNRVLC